MRVKCLAQEHNTICPARARTQIGRSDYECRKYEANAPKTAVKSSSFAPEVHEKLSFVCRIRVENEINVRHLALSTDNEACNNSFLTSYHRPACFRLNLDSNTAQIEEA